MLDDNAFVKAYEPWLKSLVYSYMAKLNLPSNVELDDLLQVGRIAMFNTRKSYDEAKGQFEQFASFRIKGAILDSLRDADWLSRSQRALTKAVEHEKQKFFTLYGCWPTELELISLVNTTKQNLIDNVQAEKIDHMMKFGSDDQVKDFPDMSANPEEAMVEKQCLAKAMRVLSKLPERAQLIIEKLFDGVASADIAHELCLSPSRVTQILREVEVKLQRQ